MEKLKKTKKTINTLLKYRIFWMTLMNNLKLGKIEISEINWETLENHWENIYKEEYITTFNSNRYY